MVSLSALAVWESRHARVVPRSPWSSAGCESFTIDIVGSAISRLREAAHDHRWDVVVGLTELSLHDDRNRIAEERSYGPSLACGLGTVLR